MQSFHSRLGPSVALLMVVMTFGVISPALAGNFAWPNWRGPTGDGIASGGPYPERWSPTENIAWSVELPEPGNSTPVIWNDRIFLTQPDGQARTIRCLDLSDGRMLWEQRIDYADPEPTHSTNPYCSASPVTDGEVVIAWLGSAGVWAGTVFGKELWRHDLGRQTHEWGTAISPVLYGEVCLVQCGAGAREYLTAFDRKSGRVLWQQDTPRETAEDIGEVGPEGQDASGRASSQQLRGAWGTPQVVNHHGTPLVIVASPLRVSAYHLQQGDLVWTCRGLGPLVYASPLIYNERVVVFGGYHSASLAVRLGGKGDVTATHRLWHASRGPLWLGSPVMANSLVFIPDMQGILHVLDANTWEERGKRRVVTGDGNQACWSSPILADGKLYLPNQSGTIAVLKADANLQTIAMNSLNEPLNASLAATQHQFILRTHQRLWCIGKEPHR